MSLEFKVQADHLLNYVAGTWTPSSGGRGPHGAQPTPAGGAVVEHAREVLAVLDRLEHATAGYRGLDTGQLVVAGTTTLVPTCCRG